MKRFTDSGRRALADGNLYVALTMALTLPDICGGLENPDMKHGPRYEDWCERWLIRRLTFPGPGGTPTVFLSAADCYLLRGRLIHFGKTEIRAKADGQPFDFEFCDKTIESHWNRFRTTVYSGDTVISDERYVQLNVDRFCELVFDAVDAWDAAAASYPSVQAEKQKLLYIRSASDPPRSTMAVDGD